MVTEAGEPAYYETAMSVMILKTERDATRGHVADITGDPGARQTLGNSWRSARYQGCRILRVSVMETRLMSDGGQLKPDQEPDSSGEAVDASASSATWDSIDYKCSEHMSPRYTVDLRGHMSTLDGDVMADTRRPTSRTQQLPRAAGTQDGGTYKSFMNGQAPGSRRNRKLNERVPVVGRNGWWCCG